MATSAAETIELLHRVPVFSALGEEDLARVAEVTVPRRFEAGEVVFREGDQSDTCYIVRSGHARATREHPDGRSITLARFGPGDIFGELAMFDDERRSATVDAIERTEAIAILGGDMRRLLREHPDIAVKLLQALGRRLRETNERLARQSFQTVQSRVASVLAQLVAAERAEGAQDGDVLITSTQADLAQLAGSSRESASRFLAVLERAGIISQGRGKLVVHDPVGARALRLLIGDRRVLSRRRRRPRRRRGRDRPGQAGCRRAPRTRAAEGPSRRRRDPRAGGDARGPRGDRRRRGAARAARRGRATATSAGAAEFRSGSHSSCSDTCPGASTITTTRSRRRGGCHLIRRRES